jgi:hypothetical protein
MIDSHHKRFEISVTYDDRQETRLFPLSRDLLITHTI